MKTVVIDPHEFEAQKALLFTRPGAPGSGYSRYAAAMYFNRLDLLPLDLLEIYRRCCKFDQDDPLELATSEGITVIRHQDLVVESAD